MNIGDPPMLPAASEQLSHLRRAIAEVEAFSEDAGSRALGVAAVDSALGGGLQSAALHEVSAAAPIHLGAMAGFALSVAALARTPHKQTLWITTDFGSLETGALYGAGLTQFGLSTESLLVVPAARPVDALYAMEEGLKCRALGTVVAEFPDTPDLTATRRLALAARDGGAVGLLLRHKASSAPSVARTRWQVASAPSIPDDYGGLGPTAFTLTLTRNRRGPCGTWTLGWDHHEQAFSALSVGVDAAASDRPDRQAVRTG
jgi:protein ImuA